MRLAQDAAVMPDHRQHTSPTPIYDALCVEYRKSFRALPGDRMGEENLGFVAFSALGGMSGGQSAQLDQPTSHGQHRGFMNGAQGHAGGRTDRESGGGRHHRPHLPALPPGTRDGRGRGF